MKFVFIIRMVKSFLYVCGGGGVFGYIGWPKIRDIHVFLLERSQSSLRTRGTTLGTTLRRRLLVSMIMKIPSFSSSKQSKSNLLLRQ